ncbi:molybdopterin-dependent oxidoreductase [Noviherbaspirillum sp. CPCC 100848]|uniref:Molybdopterin-dependent oxidoreductase n=1 Tax=Noviherbaspirillum album TaxID=3080276 RepID=A0ABU6J5K0_9BURK|nr:molybdopterin-dependent oxidoreductase [Noviherbaspirillum sp. CPCC 100848]MEC4718906.1 molybdopterin-dependent oxidoreductase [Noviherbaspirillum sp. CPCC 100848]
MPSENIASSQTAGTTEAIETVAHRICPLCEACCGLEVRVRDNKVIGIRGHAEDVFSRGYICPKGVSLKDLHEDPDRLRTPLIKRDGRFVEASWEEAFDEIARRLPPVMQAHGSDAVASVIGNPSAHKIGLLMYFSRLNRALGSRNFFSASTLDQMPKQLSCGLMFGNWLSFPVPDIERSDFLLIIGANPIVSNGSLWTVPDYRGKAKAMRARGGRIAVIDPRRTETAAAADEHHFIRPGTDVFLLLGMVHALFDEQLVNPGRIAPHLNGVEEVRAAVQDFTPESMAPRCGMDAGTIRALARRLAAAERAAVYGRMGTCTQEYGTLCSWLIDVLNALTGHLDREGGAMFAKAPAFAANTMGKPGIGKGVSTGRRVSRVSGAPEVMGEFPMVCLAEEIETPGDGQVRALITIAGNPVLSAPNGARLAAALDSLEFMVSVDIYLNETTRHADVILPGLSPLEDLHYDMAFPQFSYRNTARYSEPVLPRDPRHPPEWQILLRLAAIAQGKGADVDVNALDDALFAEDVRRLAGEHADAIIAALSHLSGPERQIDLGLRTGPYGDQFGRNPAGLSLQKLKAAPQGIDLGPLQPRIPEMLRTPSGKVELAPEMLIGDLSRVRGALAEPVPPMVIIGRRQVRSCNSWMHNLPTLAKGPYRCTALIHPDDAKKFGLRDGGMARIGSGGRTIDAVVEFSDEMMPGVLSLPHGWGHDMPGTRMAVAAERPGSNLNTVLDERRRDPLSGNAVLSGVAVEVTAIG